MSGLRVVMIGATGAVGSRAAASLLRVVSGVERLTLFGRRPLEGATDNRVAQHAVDLFQPSSYSSLLKGHQIAICTMGVGQPSKVSREEFLRVDKLAVLDFATACKAANVEHFQLLSSVGADAQSRSFYLRTKGELEDGLRALGFRRLSLFRPSMILTPANRYGLAQGVLLTLWPLLQPALAGPFRKYRGIQVDSLGRAIAMNTVRSGPTCEILDWDQITALARDA